jgi:hypothetical protein
LAAWKMCKNSGIILQNHRWLPVGIFSDKNCRVMFFEAGFWKAFQNLGIIFKGASKNIEFYFSSTKKEKIAKTISANTESTY